MLLLILIDFDIFEFDVCLVIKYDVVVVEENYWGDRLMYFFNGNYFWMYIGICLVKLIKVQKVRDVWFKVEILVDVVYQDKFKKIFVFFKGNK